MNEQLHTIDRIEAELKSAQEHLSSIRTRLSEANSELRRIVDSAERRAGSGK